MELQNVTWSQCVCEWVKQERKLNSKRSVGGKNWRASFRTHIERFVYHRLHVFIVIIISISSSILFGTVLWSQRSKFHFVRVDVNVSVVWCQFQFYSFSFLLYSSLCLRLCLCLEWDLWCSLVCAVDDTVQRWVQKYTKMKKKTKHYHYLSITSNKKQKQKIWFKISPTCFLLDP